MASLEKITDDLWAHATPHRFMGLALGARMTVLRLPDRSVALFSPTAIDDALAAEIAAVGEVAHIIAPNRYHHVYAGPAQARYPKAKLHAAEGLRRKRKDLRIDADWTSASRLGEGLTPVTIEGSMLGETVIHDARSGTIVSVDLVENFVTMPSDTFTRLYLRASGLTDGVAWSLFLRPAYNDRRAARRSLDRLLEMPWDRAIIAHGDILGTGAREDVRRAMAWIRG